MAEFIAALPGEKPLVSLLPYHNIAAHKYNKLGSNYEEFDMAEPSEEEINQILNTLTKKLEAEGCFVES